MSWNVKWMRVWNLCSPFIFCNIVCWFWVWHFFPIKAEIDQIGRNIDARQCIEITKLKVENKNLKNKYAFLYYRAREAHGQKAELHRQLQEWQARAIDLEITMSGGNTKTKRIFTPTLQERENEVELDGGSISLSESKNERQEE